MCTIEELKEKGNKAFKEKDFATAVSYYRRGLEIDSTNLHLNNNLAQTYLCLEDYLNAEIHAVVALAIDSNSIKGFFRATKAAYLQGELARANSYLKKGLSAFPTSQELLRLRGNLSHFKEKRDKKSTVVAEDNSIKETMKKGSNKNKNKSRSRSTSMSSTKSKEDKNNECRNSEFIEPDEISKLSKKQRKRAAQKEKLQLEKSTFLSLLKEQLQSTFEPAPLSEKDDDALKVKNLMKEGSDMLEKRLARNAVDKFKEALNMSFDHDIKRLSLTNIDVLVLKYALSISYIETTNYDNIVEALTHLSEIEKQYCTKIPAVYYAFGCAYIKLNRFKAALEYVNKGLVFVDKDLNIEPFAWPGTGNVCKESSKHELKDSLNALKEMCHTYHEPDAVCKYGKCLEISTHILPSESIFFSDPDFIGYVVVICEEKCRIEYHISCWKDYKEKSVEHKLSDKDFLGQPCPTTDCMVDQETCSSIIKIEIYGDDGNIKSQCLKKLETTNNIVKEIKKIRKKKPEKSNNNSNSIKPKIKHNKPKKANPNDADQQYNGVHSVSDIQDSIRRLDSLRKISFGYNTEEEWNPRLPSFGHPDRTNTQFFLNRDPAEDIELYNKKEFIFSYFYEYLSDEGPQNISDVESKWEEEALCMFPDMKSVISHGICSFLTLSLRFAIIGDLICIAEESAICYEQVKSTLVGVYSFCLQNLPSRSEIEHQQNDTNEAATPLPTSSHHSNLDFYGTSLETEETNSDSEGYSTETENSDSFKNLKQLEDDEMYLSDGSSVSFSLAEETNEVRNFPNVCNTDQNSTSTVLLSTGCQIVENCENDLKSIIQLQAEVATAVEEAEQLKIAVLKIKSEYDQLESVKISLEGRIQELEAENFYLQKTKSEEIIKLNSQVNSLQENLEQQKVCYKQKLKESEEKFNEMEKSKKDEILGLYKQTLKLEYELVSSKIVRSLEKCDEESGFLKQMFDHLTDTSPEIKTDVLNGIIVWEEYRSQMEDLKTGLQKEFEIRFENVESTSPHADIATLQDIVTLPERPETHFKCMESIIKKLVMQCKLAENSNMMNRKLPSLSNLNGDLFNSWNVMEENRKLVSPQNFFEFNVAQPINKTVATDSDIFAPIVPKEKEQIHCHSNGEVNALKNQETQSWAHLFTLSSSEQSSKLPVNENAITQEENTMLIPSLTRNTTSASIKKQTTGSVSKVFEPTQAEVPSLTKQENKLENKIGNSGSSTPKQSNYQRLFKKVRDYFSNYTENEVKEAIAELRVANDGHLSGLTFSVIINRLEDILENMMQREAISSDLGMDKFGPTAWGKIQYTLPTWNKPKDRIDDDCVICMDELLCKRNDSTALPCMHVFHSKCIRKWLKTKSVCPMCNAHTILDEEFPPLA